MQVSCEVTPEAHANFKIYFFMSAYVKFKYT